MISKASHLSLLTMKVKGERVKGKGFLPSTFNLQPSTFSTLLKSALHPTSIFATLELEACYV
jgi:hypothetical protein